MRIVVVAAALVLVAGAAEAQSRSADARAIAGVSQPGPDVIHEGEIETYIAKSGESTGWRLRTRTPQGRRRFIEVLLTAEVAQGVRANTRVQVRGTMQTRHYEQRGDVEVLVAREVIEVARR
jgi:hypothetical protein